MKMNNMESLQDTIKVGYKAVVCYGADEAIKTLEDYFKGE